MAKNFRMVSKWTKKQFDEAVQVYKTEGTWKAVAAHFGVHLHKIDTLRQATHGTRIFKYDGYGNQYCRLGEHYRHPDDFHQFQDSCCGCMQSQTVKTEFTSLVTPPQLAEVFKMRREGKHLREIAVGFGLKWKSLINLAEKSKRAHLVCLYDEHGNRWCTACEDYVPTGDVDWDRGLCKPCAKARALEWYFENSAPKSRKDSTLEQMRRNSDAGRLRKPMRMAA